MNNIEISGLAWYILLIREDRCMGRAEINPGYDSDKAKDELMKAVVDYYLNPPKDYMAGPDCRTRMKYMELEFHISMTKIRKLLVTSGVYSFEKNGVELVQKIAGLRAEGLSESEIMKQLDISAGTLNSLTPYSKGVYNAEYTASGYDYKNVSLNARRKRNQRKRELIKDPSVVDEHVNVIENVKDLVDDKVFPELSAEEVKQEKVRIKLDSIESSKAKPDCKKKSDSIDDSCEKGGVSPFDNENVLGDKWESSKTVNGRPIGDFLFFPDMNSEYLFPDGKKKKLDNLSVIGVLDAFHEKHVFVIHITFRKGGICTAEANEIKRITKGGKLFSGQPKTDYYFSLSDSHDNDVSCIGNLIDNIVFTLQNPSHSRIPECSGYYFPDRNCYLAANETGRIGIRCKDGEEVSFVVDGMELAPEDFASMFSIYEGFELHYAVREPCLIFTNDMTLYPVKMDEASFGDELTKLLIALSDKHEGKFIGKKEVPVFDTMLEDLLKKLNYYHYVNPNQAEKAGSLMIRILRNTGTDSDVFPEYEILKIKEAVRFPWESYLKD